MAEGERPREAVYGEIFTHDLVSLSSPLAGLKYRWVRQGDWKLIVPAKDGPAAGEPPELFNLASDPDEKTNRIEEHPEITERLRTLLNEWWDPDRDSVNGAVHDGDYQWNGATPRGD